jgi:hypothetical protein
MQGTRKAIAQTRKLAGHQAAQLSRHLAHAAGQRGL